MAGLLCCLRECLHWHVRLDSGLHLLQAVWVHQKMWIDPRRQMSGAVLPVQTVMPWNWPLRQRLMLTMKVRLPAVPPFPAGAPSGYRAAARWAISSWTAIGYDENGQVAPDGTATSITGGAGADSVCISANGTVTGGIALCPGRGAE